MIKARTTERTTKPYRVPLKRSGFDSSACAGAAARSFDKLRTNGATEGTLVLADVGGHTTFRPRIPVLSHVAMPVFIRLMKPDIRKDMAGLKEFCETGKVAGREPAASGSGGNQP